MTRCSIENPWSSSQLKFHGQAFNSNPWPELIIYLNYKCLTSTFGERRYTSKLMVSLFQVAALTVRFGRLTEEYQGFKVKGYVNEEKKVARFVFQEKTEHRMNTIDGQLFAI